MAAGTAPHSPLWRWHVGWALSNVAGVALLTLLGGDPADAQFVTNPSTGGATLPPPATSTPPPSRSGAAQSLSTSVLAPRRDPSAQMLVQASEIQYDYANQRVSAVGKVQIYYEGSTLEADRVVYDQRAKRLRAEGNVRLTEANGNIVYAELLDLTEDFRDGFVDSLRLDAPDRTRFAAARAERTAGNLTVFQSGVYTACEPCKEDPKKPPLWQVKAARIIHDESEKMIYFEDARLEFLGTPLAHVPFFSAPDPTVKRKTGFLVPRYSTSTKYGFGVEVPYFWALAPDYDLTLNPRITTMQGVLMQGEWRQRLVNGSYSVRGAGIFQLDKNEFLRPGAPPTPGFRDSRGGIATTGQFALSDKWVWGWDATLLSDKTFLQDYGLIDPTITEAVSQLYLAGRGDRSYFDARLIHYYGLSEFDTQSQLPTVHPVIDYFYKFDRPIFGGELGYGVNFTSLTRQSADFDPITQNAINASLCEPFTADPAQKNRTNCILRGVPGTYSRLSAEMEWRRTIVDPYGQMFTPFVSLRADVAAMSLKNDPGVSNFITPGGESLARGMPAVGLEYRYPFINVQSWGTQTIEPIAQVIARPNETQIGKFPNEDAQSLIFDDVNLFSLDKFSGWDRVEGGGRANVGVQYTAQFNGGGFANALFGQSYHLFGLNSYAVGDLTNTGLESGLDSDASDYVARFTYQPNQVYAFTSRFRFDEQTFDTRRLELEGRANYDRWSVAMIYGNYDAQPELGLLAPREGILGSASVKLNANWSVTGIARYDLDADRFNQTGVGVGYIDDCFAMVLSYMADYGFSGNPQPEQRVMLQVTLRTLGGTSFNQRISGTDTTTNTTSSIGRTGL